MPKNHQFTLRLDIPKDYPKRWRGDLGWAYPCCHNSDGLTECDCVLKCENPKHTLETCVFWGRPIEPLAFYLPPFAAVDQQDQCPLYTVLPKEIRDLVWEYALTDDAALAPNCDNIFRREKGRQSDIIKVDIAHALLQTCKVIYLETYRLPMQINGYLSYAENRSRPDLQRITPWQYALIQRVDLSLQQFSLEGDGLERDLESWNARLRPLGTYVAPRLYKASRLDRTKDVKPAHNFGLFTPSEKSENPPKDGAIVTLPQSDDNPFAIGGGLSTASSARAFVARPLTHLTLRMSRTDWWTWGDKPEWTGDRQQLALDPACGDGDESSRPTVADMLALAESRRSGKHPAYKGTWGAVIASFPELKTFELILETFAVKTRQLDIVAECAKTWKFPLKRTPFELAYDGKMIPMQWTEEATEKNLQWFDNEENEDLESGEEDGSSVDEEDEDYDSNEEATSSAQSVVDSDQDTGNANVVDVNDIRNNDPEDLDSPAHSRASSDNGNSESRSVDPSSPVARPYPAEHDSPQPPSYSPTSPGLNPDDFSPTSPHYGPKSSQYSSCYSPTSPAYSPSYPYGWGWPEAWAASSTESEVRVLRFKRQRKS